MQFGRVQAVGAQMSQLYRHKVFFCFFFLRGWFHAFTVNAVIYDQMEVLPGKLPHLTSSTGRIMPCRRTVLFVFIRKPIWTSMLLFLPNLRLFQTTIKDSNCDVTMEYEVCFQFCSFCLSIWPLGIRNVSMVTVEHWEKIPSHNSKHPSHIALSKQIDGRNQGLH